MLNINDCKCAYHEKRGSRSYPSSEVSEKDASKTGYLNILINDACCHFTDLTFDLDHVIQNQMRQNEQRVLSDRCRLITQSTHSNYRIHNFSRKHKE